MKKKPMIIAISAVSGGGKTTIISALASQLKSVKVFHFDDYDIEGPADFGSWALEGGSYDDWNVEAIVQDVSACSEQEEINYILLDYPFSYLNQQMKELIHLSIYIDTPLDIAMARRFLRTPAKSIEEVVSEYEGYLSVGRKAYEIMETSVKPSVDYVIDGHLDISSIVNKILEKL